MTDARGYTKTATLLSVAFALLALPAPSLAWAPVVHQAVTAKAVDALPKGLKDFYKAHRRELPSLMPEAEPEEETPAHRFAADRLLPFPFSDLPQDEAAFKAKFPEQADGVGRLPWLIHEAYARLVEAFKSADKGRILSESDVLATLVTDLNNPLALTDNADGHKSGQHGLWVRFTVRFPSGMKDFDLEPDAAHLLERPREYVFSVVTATYIWVDNLLYLDDLSHRGAPGYGDIYFANLEQRAGRLLRDRLSAATGDVASYWYTAWTEAGRPELK